MSNVAISPKIKPINYKYISRTDPSYDSEIYKMIDEITGKYYPDLVNASIIVIKRVNTKPDLDGYAVVAEIKKSTDLMKELLEHDLMMIIHDSIWDTLAPDSKMCALDTELSRAVISTDKSGAYKQDEAGRFVWRLKRRLCKPSAAITKRYNIDSGSIVECGATSHEDAEGGNTHNEESDS